MANLVLDESLVFLVGLVNLRLTLCWGPGFTANTQAKPMKPMPMRGANSAVKVGCSRRSRLLSSVFKMKMTHTQQCFQNMLQTMGSIFSSRKIARRGAWSESTVCGPSQIGNNYRLKQRMGKQLNQF